MKCPALFNLQPQQWIAIWRFRETMRHSIYDLKAYFQALKQFLATKSPLKMMTNVFHLP